MKKFKKKKERGRCIRIIKLHMFRALFWIRMLGSVTFGLPDLDPLGSVTDPDPAQNQDPSYCIFQDLCFHPDDVILFLHTFSHRIKKKIGLLSLYFV